MRPADVLKYFPTDRFGAVIDVTPLSPGLSGSGVYAVTTADGDYVLRVHSHNEEGGWERQLAGQRLAAEAGVAPRLVLVDEAARATVSVKVKGSRFSATVMQPGSRAQALVSLVDQLTALHAAPTTGLVALDPAQITCSLWDVAAARQGFPAWARPLGESLGTVAAALARDPRRVLSHNDVNPTNLLWDGSRVWFVDFEASGLNHPYFDLAAADVFLRFSDEEAFQLLERQVGAELTPAQRQVFESLRQLARILFGLIFLRPIPDLGVLPQEPLAATPTLRDCYRMIGEGTLDLQSPRGKGLVGLAILRRAVEGREG